MRDSAQNDTTGIYVRALEINRKSDEEVTVAEDRLDGEVYL
jgi:hypothetical protein